MQVMTFGASCSPATAQYVKNLNAEEFKARFPRAVDAIINNHYVDDWLQSVKTEEETIMLAKEVMLIHEDAGFQIRNWKSNSQKVLSSLGENLNPVCDITKMGENDTIEKVLGMFWRPSDDAFTFSLKYNKANKDILTGKKRPTKREVLRTLSSIYDPLGLIANILVLAKILLQEIWRAGTDWDAQIQDKHYEKWLMWINLLPQVELLRIPRCYMGNVSAQLHTFVDAGEDAFGAVAYFRFFDDTNEDVHCALIGSKTRVSPIKMQSIPRLELDACVLGARFAHSIASAHTIRIQKRFFWCDSKTAMSWIRSDHRRYRPFVAFRVSEILDTTQLSEWHWLPSKSNIADDVTKWPKCLSFSSNSRWFTGPDILYDAETTWTEEKDAVIDTVEDLKFHAVHEPITVASYIIQFDKFSRWSSLVRAQSFVFRFIHNCRCIHTKLQKKTSTYFTSEELAYSENHLYIQSQIQCFKNERVLLLRNQSLPVEKQLQLDRHSQLSKLSPYIDQFGVMRVKGRIFNASNVDFNAKFPIILHPDHHITHLIIHHFHSKYCHINHETVINELRQKFSISRLRVLLKKIRKDCQRCINANTVPHPPEMGNLPAARLASFMRPFSYIGIDYFGPMLVTVGRRSEKRWGVLITCLTIRAIHIEVAHSLSADSCILCLENFINRRGQPLEIFSDHGTNFIGTDRELYREILKMDQQKMATKFTSSTTKWTFIPPLAPHMGGSWERMVQSVKKTLAQIQPRRNPSDELLMNMLIQVENIINSRPLTYMPLDDVNDEALTPNHFLVGSSNGSKPRGDFNDDGIVWRKNWMKSQQYANEFWKRWVKEYLPTLTRRTKWFQQVKPIEIGDVVIIVDEKGPKNCWPKGVVIDVMPGRDGQVRKAVVKTVSGVYERPATKLAVLDVKKRDDGIKSSMDLDLLGENVANAPIKPTRELHSVIRDNTHAKERKESTSVIKTA